MNSNTTLKIVIKPQKKRTKEGKKKEQQKSKTINKMAIRTYVSIIALSVNELNAPSKRHRMAE